jgi:hypothetical protein
MKIKLKEEVNVEIAEVQSIKNTGKQNYPTNIVFLMELKNVLHAIKY